MSATLTRPVVAAPTASTPERAGTRALGDRRVIAVLAVLFAAIVAITWRKWGMPEGDAGAELTTADLIKHGAVAYRDMRYFYGPLGLYALALAFKIFGTSFTVVYAFGLAQAAAILGAFYALARQWLTPLVAGLSTAVLLAIGFSGTSFNFVVPHTNSATFGLLALLLMLLALCRHRLIAAGLAAGLVGLTRPEYIAVAVGVAIAYVLATARTEGRRASLNALWRLAAPGLVLPMVVLGWFAARTGLHNLIFQNLWPSNFLRAGLGTEKNWMPISVASAFGLVARGAVYGGLFGAVVLSAEAMSRRRGLQKALALWPIVAVGAAIAAADLLLRAAGLFTDQRTAIQTEIHHLILGMSALPAVGVGVFVWAVVRLLRRGEAPLGRSWPADFALIVAAVGLGLRAFNAFTAEGSYAPYYAAPLVLVLGILHSKVAASRPQARVAVLAALGCVGAGLAAYSLFGLYRHIDVAVHTPRGTFVTMADAAPALQATIRTIDRDTTPGQHILAAPLDGGLYFMSDREPAIYQLSVLPGLLYSRADQEQAIARLRHDHVALAVLAARNFALWGVPTFGVNYDATLGTYLRDATSHRTVIGTLRDPAAGTYPSKGFTLLQLAR